MHIETLELSKLSEVSFSLSERNWDRCEAVDEDLTLP